MKSGLVAGLMALVAMAGPAGAADAAAVKAACAKSTSWSAAACECLAKRSASLSPVQRDYVVAALSEDTAAGEKAQAALSVTEFADVSTFMVNGLTDCGNE
ncbi:MAG: hypothetical protein KDJ41_18665 [Hyphomicrobiaceae bacterium]|nr:hypothetical protein [Bauldia sp.]MCB1549830.1 hypothetical protein [Hyphomicrobiaceae bacterium]